MHHVPPMLVTLVVALALALALGYVARLLRLPPLFGYLVAGALISPHSPGFVAEAEFTATLADVGVALLLFGVGLHFRPADLAAVWRIALPGAVLQVAAASLLGGLVGRVGLGLDLGPAAVFGLTLAIASTAVATRTLEDGGMLASGAGRIALGWLVVQDLLVVIALVLVPAAAGPATDGVGPALVRAVLELLAFGASVFLLGRRALPWALARIARGRSGELFTLGVVVAALGVAFAASQIFGVSFALGAFFAGVLLGESDLGHQAAAEAMPLQRVFAALFFVSVGMLFDPVALLASPAISLGALLAVLLGTGGLTFALLLAFRVEAATAAVVAGALAQIGEFSFLLVKFGIAEGVLPAEASAPILTAAFGAILLTPISERGFALLARWLLAMPRWRNWQERRRGPPIIPPPGTPLAGHAILVGHGRVGRVVAEALRRHGLPLVVLEADRLAAERALAEDIPVIWGDAGRPEVLQAARPEAARLVVLALPDAAEAQRVLALVRAANPSILAAARAHDDDDMALLSSELGVGLAVMGEREIALGIADYAMQRLGVDTIAAQRTVDALRAEMAERY